MFKIMSNISNCRTSRLDQLENNTEPRHATRPSSLPYKPAGQTGKNGKITPQRRAVSTSVNRKPQSKTPKYVIFLVGNRRFLQF